MELARPLPRRFLRHSSTRAEFLGQNFWTPIKSLPADSAGLMGVQRFRMIETVTKALVWPWSARTPSAQIGTGAEVSQNDGCPDCAPFH